MNNTSEELLIINNIWHTVTGNAAGESKVNCSANKRKLVREEIIKIK